MGSGRPPGTCAVRRVRAAGVNSMQRPEAEASAKAASAEPKNSRRAFAAWLARSRRATRPMSVERLGAEKADEFFFERAVDRHLLREVHDESPAHVALLLHDDGMLMKECLERFQEGREIGRGKMPTHP